MEIEELERKRAELQEKVEKAKIKRDKLNRLSKKLGEERDSFNAKVRKYRNEAIEHKKKRDEFNKRVKAHKKKRDDFAKQYKKFGKKVARLKKERLPKDGTTLGNLRKEIEALEFKQMTQQLKKEEEKEIIDRLSEVSEKLKEKERIIQEDGELREAIEEMERMRGKCDEEHEKFEEFIEKADIEHEKYIKCFKKSDELREKADLAQDKYFSTNLEANDYHNQFISLIKEIRKIEGEIAKIKKEEKSAIERKKRDEMEKVAEEIYERFKKGEKLSTEDLRTLQKAGFI